MGTVITRTDGPDEFVAGHDMAVLGLGGDDTLRSIGQNVVLVGNGGNDVLLGSAFSDVLGGSEGDNTLTGGAGQDVFVIQVPRVVVTPSAPDGVEEVARQTITDFELGRDRIGLPLGLTFAEVEVVTLREEIPIQPGPPALTTEDLQAAGDNSNVAFGFGTIVGGQPIAPPQVEIQLTTQIRLLSTGSVLAVLPDIDGDRLTEADFVQAETVEFETSAITVGEEGASATALTLTRSFPELSQLSNPLPVAVQITGAGDVTTDFASDRLEGSFIGGDRTLPVILPLIDDVLQEGDEIFSVALVADAARFRVGDQSTAAVTVVDNDIAPPPVLNPGIIGVMAPVVRANEEDGTAEVLVERSGGSDGAVSATVFLANGSAIAGSDFIASPTPAVVTFADGDLLSKTVTIPLVDDVLQEDLESFTVQLSNPTGGVALGASTTTVEIVDGDEPAGVVEFAAPSFSVVEGVPLLSVPVVRSGGSSGRVTVNVAVANGTALEGPDFRSPPGPIGLVFENGEAGAKNITFAITDDLFLENPEAFSLALFNPVGGIVLGAHQTTTVTIQDNDGFQATVDFAPAGDLVPFPVDPLTGIRFSSNVLGIVNFDGGGSGNFVDPLLPPTAPAQAATYAGAGTMLVTVDAGFRDRLRFRYGAPFALDPAVDPDGDGLHEVLIFDGPDGTGNVLAIAELPLTTDTLLPIGAFELTTNPFEVTFNGVARSVAIGSQGDRIVVDDLTFG